MGKIRPNMHEVCMKIKKPGTKLKKKSAKNLGRQKKKSVKKKSVINISH